MQEAEAAGIGAHVGATREAILLPLVVDSVLGLVDSVEKLTAIVVVPAEPGMPSPKREWAARDSTLSILVLPARAWLFGIVQDGALSRLHLRTFINVLCYPQTAVVVGTDAHEHGPNPCSTPQLCGATRSWSAAPTWRAWCPCRGAACCPR